MTSRTLNMEGMTDASDKNSFMFFINESSFSSTKACKISASTNKPTNNYIVKLYWAENV